MTPAASQRKMDVAPGRKLGQAIDGLANAVIVTIQVRRGCSRQYSCRALARDRAMAKSPICIVLGLAVLFAHAAPFGAPAAYGAECKRKIAGFYLEELDQTRPHKLSRGSENLPASLTGIAGNSEHGRDVFISAQKGGCVSCHQLSTLSPAIAQGSVGPTLDGAGTKYNEATAPPRAAPARSLLSGDDHAILLSRWEQRGIRVDRGRDRGSRRLFGNSEIEGASTGCRKS